jgi:predicted metalloenzyme YecM
MTDRELDLQIKKKLKGLDKASSNEKHFLGKELKEGQEIVPMDFYEMAEAFDTTSLRRIELDILLAKRYRFDGWEKTTELLEIQAEELRNKIVHWKKREFPSESKH